MNQGDHSTPEGDPEPSLVFEVLDRGTIKMLGVKMPTTHSDIFDAISTSGTDADELIDEVEQVLPLVARLQELALSEYERLSEEFEDLDSDDQARFEDFVESFDEDSEDSWKDWIRCLDDAGLRRCGAEIQTWLDEPIDWAYSDDFPANFGPEGQAVEFFENLDSDTLDDIGVSLVYGDRPGSNYCFARLDRTVDEANEQAEELGEDFRFVQMTKDSPHSPAGNPG